MPVCPGLKGSRPLPAPRRALVAALLVALAPATSSAAIIVVTSPDDSDTAAIGTCTLRQAIMSIDVGGLVGACHKTGAFGVDDTLMFAGSALNDAATPGTVTLADSADPNGGLGGTLVISASHLTIDGSPWRGSGEGLYPDGVTIARPAGASNKFGVIKDMAPAGSELVLKGIAIRNGYAWEPLCGGGREGGGICMVAADLSMSDSRVSGNFAAFGGGGISSPAGAVALTRCTIDANVAYLGGGVHSASGTVTVIASMVSGNGEWAVSHGGGIRADGTLAVVDSAISGNAGKRGAGLYIGGTATLTRSVAGSNDTYYDAGGIFVSESGTVTLDSSTIAGNHARYNGGGLYVAGVLNATNSTIAGNGVYRSGGGIALAQGGTLHLDHATVARNGTSSAGGGIGTATWPSGIPWTGSATIEHSIVSDNTQGKGGDIDADITWTGSGNLISSADALLGPLQDNGGPTLTMLPGPGSAALDAIAPQDCTQDVDQRGMPRPSGAGCDIGAVEVFVDAIFTDGFDDESSSALHDGPS